VDTWLARERGGLTTNAFLPPGLSRSPSVAKVLVINSDNAVNGLGYLVMVCSSSCVAFNPHQKN